MIDRPAIRRIVPAVALAFSAACNRGPTVPAEVLRSAEAREAGAALFAANCAICHGSEGRGEGARRAGFDAPPPDFRTRAWRERMSPARIAAVIRKGKKPTSMPAWPNLTDREVDALVAYLWSLSEPRGS